MGHEDPGTTYKHYSKLSNDDVKNYFKENESIISIGNDITY